jgi:hypothetical protein
MQRHQNHPNEPRKARGHPVNEDEKFTSLESRKDRSRIAHRMYVIVVPTLNDRS